MTCSRSCLNWRQQYDRSRQHPQLEVVLLAAAHSSQLAPHAGKHEREDMGRVLQVPAGSCDVGHMWAVQHAAAFQQNMVLVGLPDINTAHAGLRFGCGVLGAGRISSAQSAWVCKCVLHAGASGVVLAASALPLAEGASCCASTVLLEAICTITVLYSVAGMQGGTFRSLL